MIGGALLVAAFVILLTRPHGAVPRGAAGIAITLACLAAAGSGPGAAGFDTAIPTAALLVGLLAVATGAPPWAGAVLGVGAVGRLVAGSPPFPIGYEVWPAIMVVGLVLMAPGARAPHRVGAASGAALLIGVAGLAQMPAHAPRLTIATGVALALTGGAALAGLAPLHRWSPLAPRLPALLAVVVHAAALLSLRMLLGGGVPLLAVGMVATVVGAADVWRRKPAARVSGLAAVQRGAVAVTFGLDDPASDAIGYLALLTISLSHAAAIVADGDLTRLARGALAGVPPSGVFAVMVGVVFAVARARPALAPVVAAALLISGASMLTDFGSRAWPGRPIWRDAPTLALLAVAAALGIVPPTLLFGP